MNAREEERSFAFASLILASFPQPSAYLQVIAELANVPKSVVDAMFVHAPVEEEDAHQVLAVVSQITGKSLTPAMLNVPTIPTVEVSHAN